MAGKRGKRVATGAKKTGAKGKKKGGKTAKAKKPKSNHIPLGVLRRRYSSLGTLINRRIAAGE